MRLIDADKMRDDWLENGENEYVYDTNAVLESIDAQPTVDAVEVVHGRWITEYWKSGYIKRYGLCFGLLINWWNCLKDKKPPSDHDNGGRFFLFNWHPGNANFPDRYYNCTFLPKSQEIKKAGKGVKPFPVSSCFFDCVCIHPTIDR